MTSVLYHLSVVLILVTGLGADNHHVPCYDDMAMCVQNLRTLMTDPTAFWFGSQYAAKCPPASRGWTDVLCINPDPAGTSVLSRIYNASTDTPRLQDMSRKLGLAHVTFDSPQGQYYGCGHTYNTPALRHQLDPLTVTTVNSWSLDHLPYIRWDPPTTTPAGNNLYTVLMWDVGFYYIHGLYINVGQGGDLSSSIAVRPYHGPINPLTRPNVILFAVFQQTRVLDAGQVGGIMGANLAANMGALSAASFLSAMTGSIGDLVAANILTVVGDGYSMERQKDNYIRNNCPLLLSQAPVLRAALDGANVMAAWSPETTTLNYKIDPYISSLTVNMEVEYSMAKDLVVESCCVKTTVTQSMYRVDPMGGSVHPARVDNKPRVHMSPIDIMGNSFSGNNYNGVKDQTYTLLMVDLTDALATRKNPMVGLVLHWMVNDIKDADIGTGHETIPYMTPNPATRNEPRAYVFLLLQQQTTTLDTSNMKDFVGGSCPDFISGRCNARLSAMLQAWGLNTIVGVTWMNVEQDALARKRTYSEYRIRDMFEVCDGLAGFEDPCPAQQYCGSTNAAHHSTTTTMTTTTGLLVLIASLMAARWLQ